MDETEGPRRRLRAPLKEGVYRFVVLRFYKGRRWTWKRVTLRCKVIRAFGDTRRGFWYRRKKER